MCEHDGGIAQLGERLHGMQEVSGSIPLTSTSQAAGQLADRLGKPVAVEAKHSVGQVA